MGIVYLVFFLSRFRSHFLFHSVYAIFLLFLLGVFAVLFLDLYLEEGKNRDLNIKLSLYNFALFYSMTMGLFTILYYQGNLPQNLVTIRNILLALVSVDILGILVLTWMEGNTQGDKKQQEKPISQVNCKETLEAVLDFMDVNALCLHRETTNYFLKSKRAARDLAMLFAILTIVVLIPLVINIERYVYNMNLFLIQYGLILTFTVLFSCFLYHKISLVNAKYSLLTLKRYENIQDKVYIFLGCIHKKPLDRERLRKEKLLYTYWTTLLLIPITLIFFFGVIPPLLRATRLISLTVLGGLAIICHRMLRLQKDYSQHIDAIENMELRPLAHIHQMSELDKNNFVKLYWPIVCGKEEVDYNSLN